MSMEMNKALDLLREIRPSIPKEVLELWCKDRDAFLASHPAVEQVGGDERAAFDAYRDRRNAVLESEGHKPGSKWHVTNAHYPTWEASRAALAQPSPKCATCGGTGMVDDGEITCSEGGIPYENGPVKCVKDCPDCKAQPSPPPHPAPELDFSRPLETENGDPVKWICADVIEYKSARVCVAKDTGLVYSSPYIGLKIRNVMPEQAEADRPEVVAWRYGFSGGIVSDKACLDEWKSSSEYQSLMTVAQHERIVGELRAVIAQLRQHKNDYMDSGQETYRALQNEIREREAEIARLDGLVSGRTAERDAALAEVNRLRESKGDPSGSFDRCMRMMYERDENAKRLDAALAKIAELEAKLSDPTAVHQWQFSNAWFDGSEENVLKAGKEGSPIRTLYTAPVAQAQHSVPGNAAALVRAEGKKYSLNAAGMLDSGAPEHAQTFAIVQLLSEFDDEEAESHWEAIMAYSDFRTSDALFHAAELLAAAPGKEGV